MTFEMADNAMEPEGGPPCLEQCDICAGPGADGASGAAAMHVEPGVARCARCARCVEAVRCGFIHSGAGLCTRERDALVAVVAIKIGLSELRGRCVPRRHWTRHRLVHAT